MSTPIQGELLDAQNFHATSSADVQQKMSEIAQKSAAVEKLAQSEGRDVTDDELSTMERLAEQYDDLKSNKLPKIQKIEKMAKDQLARQNQLAVQQPAQLQPAETLGDPRYSQMGGQPMECYTMPDIPRTRMEAFTPERFGNDHNRAMVAATEAGHFFAAQMFGLPESVQFCLQRNHLAQHLNPMLLHAAGREYMVQHVADPTLGGFSVPTHTAALIFDVRDRAGAVAGLARNYRMVEETDLISKRDSGLTVYKPDELSEITASDKVISQVSVVARDASTLTHVSRKLARGSVFNFADQVVNEIGYAFSRQIDYEGISGDGTAGQPNWGITGYLNGIGSAGLITATGATSYDTITVKHLNKLIGHLPDRFHTRSAGAGGSGAQGQPAFLCSHSFWAETFANLSAEAGGNTMINLGQNAPFTYLGFPIIFSDEMPRAYAGTQTCLLFGNFFEASIMAEREAVSIDMSMHHRFSYNQVSFRGNIAYDFKFHEPGDAVNPGGVVGLQTPV